MRFSVCKGIGPPGSTRVLCLLGEASTCGSSSTAPSFTPTRGSPNRDLLSSFQGLGCMVVRDCTADQE